MKEIYKILLASDARSLEKAVTNCLNEGWGLAGGVVLGFDADGSIIFAQAVRSTDD